MVNLPNPLTASDELFLSKLGTHKVIRLTAGVHRQTWVSGIAMFVDVHISNSSSKTVRKIEFQLEKVTTFYDYAAAATKTEIATHLRLPDRTEKEIVARSSVKKARNGWHGVLPQSQDIRTCRLDVPAGLITVNTGTFWILWDYSHPRIRVISGCHIYTWPVALLPLWPIWSHKQSGE